jgi:hypothetical protein
MNLPEWLKDKPLRAAAIIGGLLLVGLLIIGFQLRGAGASADTRTRAFFSIDDGKTWFADDASKLPPFQKDGKQAVLARVYRCSNGTEFVNYLERFKPDAKQALENAAAGDPTGKSKPDQNAIRNAYSGGREIKRPGGSNWIASSNYREASQVMAVKCPNGDTNAVPVEP